MISIKNKLGIETLVFAKTFEQEAYDQVKRLCNHDAYAREKIRVMPDVHAGKGCTIGTTMTISDKVTPNLVGVDIGCGMLTIRLEEKDVDFPELDAVIRAKIPSGFDIHKHQQRDFDFSDIRCRKSVDLSRAALSIGSLGGGNHFIEAGRAKNSGDMYLVIHSGSRKLGTDVCEYYQKKAVQSSGKQAGERDLAYLTGGDFDDYMNDMAIIQDYARVNRETMAAIIIKEMGLREVDRFQTIHNYIDFKRMILRKGAVSAEENEVLLIPVNMRDGSLLCRGRGNEEWNYSAPHGAGRLMSRTRAKKSIRLEEFRETMKGVYTTSVGNRTLDEAPQAYKSIEEIRAAITDTADIVDVIRPLYNFKAP